MTEPPPQDSDPDPAGPPGGVAVEISDTQPHLAIDPASLAALAGRVLAGEGVDRGSLSVALVDDPTIRVLNRKHLGHDWATDVISFPLSGPGEPFAGELVVSAETAARAAGAAGVEPREELALYLVHGLLHLCGWNDQTEAEALAMRRREAEVLAAEGLPDVFALAGGAREVGP